MDWPLIGYADMPIIQKFSSLCLKKLVLTPRHTDFFVFHTLNPARSEFLLRFVVQGANLSVPGMLGFGMNWH